MTIVKGCKNYGRYMDDIYLIHEDYNFIKKSIAEIEKIASGLGLFVNKKKTKICKLSRTFTYLQIKYFLTDTGRVVRRINPKSLTRERKRLKAHKRLLDAGKIQYSDIEQIYKSWMGNFSRIMSKKQIKNIRKLYMSLFNKDPKWKHC